MKRILLVVVLLLTLIVASATLNANGQALPPLPNGESA